MSEPVRCPWCKKPFESAALAKPHVKHCAAGPFQRRRHAVRMGPKVNRKQLDLFTAVAEKKDPQ